MGGRPLSRWPGLLKGRRRSLLRLADRCGARNVRLFGSVARGEAGPKSDVDLLVDMDAGRGMFDLIEFEEKAADLLGCEVDVLTVPALSPYLRDRILAEARPL